MDGVMISKIDVRPVSDGYDRVVDYVFKTIKRGGRVSYDEGVLILPRTRDELTSRRIVQVEARHQARSVTE
jgi:hypothetical protein